MISQKGAIPRGFIWGMVAGAVVIGGVWYFSQYPLVPEQQGQQIVQEVSQAESVSQPPSVTKIKPAQNNTSQVGNKPTQSQTIGYGSRAGMEVTVLSKTGLDTSKAIIRTAHTRENAITYCRDYELNVTEECIQRILATNLKESITANCATGIFTDFDARTYQFFGINVDASLLARYTVMDTASGEVLAGGPASGYPVEIGIFKALCPNKATGAIYKQ